MSLAFGQKLTTSRRHFTSLLSTPYCSDWYCGDQNTPNETSPYHLIISIHSTFTSFNTKTTTSTQCNTHSHQDTLFDMKLGLHFFWLPSKGLMAQLTPNKLFGRQKQKNIFVSRKTITLSLNCDYTMITTWLFCFTLLYTRTTRRKSFSFNYSQVLSIHYFVLRPIITAIRSRDFLLLWSLQYYDFASFFGDRKKHSTKISSSSNLLSLYSYDLCISGGGIHKNVMLAVQ